MSDTTLTTLPVLPVKRTVLFPGVRVPLTVGRDRSVAAVEFALKTEEKTVLIVSQRDPETSEPTLENLYQIGTTDFQASVRWSPDHAETQSGPSSPRSLMRIPPPRRIGRVPRSGALAHRGTRRFASPEGPAGW